MEKTDLTQIMQLIYWRDSNGTHVYIHMRACVVCREGDESSHSTAVSQQILSKTENLSSKTNRLEQKDKY